MSEADTRYHEGELAAQRLAGEEEAADMNAAVVAGAVPPAAGRFLAAQRMLVVASLDGRGRPWASVVFGMAGFASAGDDGRLVTIGFRNVYGGRANPPWSDLADEAPLGLLAIDFATRRRLRVNGWVESIADEQLVLGVEQAYPNCPKYIQRRRLVSLAPREEPTPPAAHEGPPQEGADLDASFLASLRSADTAFVASGHPVQGLDASHRGGRPGFIEFLPPNVLRVPDYEGNGMFNTLGNLLVDGRCGLTVLDFDHGRLHQVTGTAVPRFARLPPRGDSDTGRSWDLQVQAWRTSEPPVRAGWQFVDFSPYNP